MFNLPEPDTVGGSRKWDWKFGKWVIYYGEEEGRRGWIDLGVHTGVGWQVGFGPNGEDGSGRMSLLANIHETRSRLALQQPDMVLVQETDLRPEKTVKIKGYAVERVD